MKLFEPISIGGMKLKNRIVMSPMTTGYAGLDQLPTPRLVEYLRARARGGVGLITLEACVVDRRHREVPQSMHFSTDDVIDRHRALVDAVHEHGAKVQPQIVHAGPDALSPQMEKIPSVGPSVITSYLTGSPSRELGADELPGIADQYASAVRRVREAGYDGIELHAAHAYMLLGSFLSPWRNKRGDEYAGRKREGRLRLLLEVLAAIRREVGADFPITLRISGYERAAGGRTIDDTARIAPRLVEAGVDAFHVSGGVIDRLTSMIVTGSQWGDAHNLGAAIAVKNAVAVPVMAVGRIHRPELAEQILQRGHADLVVMARPLLADPELPEKLRTQRSGRIRPCVSCENCIDSMESANMNCAVNGLAGREGALSLAPSAAPKRVLVVGGGPGGLETARLAALRGHRVTLVERERHLGGSLVYASLVHGENEPFLRFLLGEVARLPIEIRRGRALAPEDVRAFAPDAVVVATGGRVVVPKIPGDERRHVKSGPQMRALLAPAARWLTPAQLAAAARWWMPFGARVVVVGADLAALELAEFLARRGRRVAIVERGERLAPEIGHKRLTEHMDALDRLGVSVNTGVAYEEITAGGIAIRPERGARREIAADTIVLAGELEADTAFFDAVKGEVPEAHTVGDCTGLGLIRKATEEATRVAAAL
jgi:2,4-dienoyl-CoA reductase-like NADH-dependent reductase (Old Yellow Enzyme family)